MSSSPKKLTGTRRSRSKEQHYSNCNLRRSSSNNNNNNNNFSSSSSSPLLVSFNCGGEIIPVHRASSTIIKKFPNSYLANFLQIVADPMLSQALDRDKDGNILLDRDPRLFLCVVNFCRGYRTVGPVSDDELEALLVEADYWCLPELRQNIEERIGITHACIVPTPYQRIHFSHCPPPEVLQRMAYLENLKFFLEMKLIEQQKKELMGMLSNDDDENDDPPTTNSTSQNNIRNKEILLQQLQKVETQLAGFKSVTKVHKTNEFKIDSDKNTNNKNNNNNTNNNNTSMTMAMQQEIRDDLLEKAKQEEEDNNNFTQEKLFFEHVHHSPFNTPYGLRFLKGPGINVDRNRVRTAFTVGLLGNSLLVRDPTKYDAASASASSSSSSTQQEEEKQQKLLNEAFDKEKEQSLLKDFPLVQLQNGTAYHHSGAALISGIHVISFEVLKCSYLGIGLMADPNGTGFLPQDQEFHRTSGCIGFYFSGVFYSNTPAFFKEDRLADFGTRGSVVQVRLDMDNRLVEFFVNGQAERMQTIGNLSRARFAVVMKGDTAVNIISEDRAAFLIGRHRAKKLAGMYDKFIAQGKKVENAERQEQERRRRHEQEEERRRQQQDAQNQQVDDDDDDDDSISTVDLNNDGENPNEDRNRDERRANREELVAAFFARRLVEERRMRLLAANNSNDSSTFNLIDNNMLFGDNIFQQNNNVNNNNNNNAMNVTNNSTSPNNNSDSVVPVDSSHNNNNNNNNNNVEQQPQQQQAQQQWYVLQQQQPHHHRGAAVSRSLTTDRNMMMFPRSASNNANNNNNNNNQTAGMMNQNQTALGLFSRNSNNNNRERSGPSVSPDPVVNNNNNNNNNNNPRGAAGGNNNSHHR